MLIALVASFLAVLSSVGAWPLPSVSIHSLLPGGGDGGALVICLPKLWDATLGTRLQTHGATLSNGAAKSLCAALGTRTEKHTVCHQMAAVLHSNLLNLGRHPDSSLGVP